MDSLYKTQTSSYMDNLGTFEVANGQFLRNTDMYIGTIMALFLQSHGLTYAAFN